MGASSVDGKADVYALGVMLYELLSGQLPYQAAHGFDYLSAHVRASPRPLAELVPAASAELVALVHHMLAKKPQQRPSMDEVAARLERLGAAGSGAATKVSRSWATPSAGIAGIAGMGLVFVLGSVWHREPVLPQPAALPSAAPVIATPRLVRWSLRSTPVGAAVVDAEGRPLGDTPLMMERIIGSGETALTLQRDGYKTQTIRLPLDASTDLTVTLEPALPQPAPIAAAPVAEPGRPISSAPTPLPARPRTVHPITRPLMPKPAPAKTKAAAASSKSGANDVKVELLWD